MATPSITWRLNWFLGVIVWHTHTKRPEKKIVISSWYLCQVRVMSHGLFALNSQGFQLFEGNEMKILDRVTKNILTKNSWHSSAIKTNSSGPSSHGYKYEYIFWGNEIQLVGQNGSSERSLFFFQVGIQPQPVFGIQKPPDLGVLCHCLKSIFCSLRDRQTLEVWWHQTGQTGSIQPIQSERENKWKASGGHESSRI